MQIHRILPLIILVSTSARFASMAPALTASALMASMTLSISALPAMAFLASPPMTPPQTPQAPMTPHLRVKRMTEWRIDSAQVINSDKKNDIGRRCVLKGLVAYSSLQRQIQGRPFHESGVWS